MILKQLSYCHRQSHCLLLLTGCHQDAPCRTICTKCRHLSETVSKHDQQTLQSTLPHSSPSTFNNTYAHICLIQYKVKLEMRANAQRDGRPAEYRWRPLFNAAKFGWHALPECRAVTVPRRETRWNLQGCPKLPDRSQPLVGRSSRYCGDIWRRYCCLTRSFFRLSIRAFVAEI